MWCELLDKVVLLYSTLFYSETRCLQHLPAEGDAVLSLLFPCQSINTEQTANWGFIVFNNRS